jgi:hypothetical protein
MTITLTIHAPDDPPSDKNTVIIWTTNGFSTWWQLARCKLYQD